MRVEGGVSIARSEMGVLVEQDREKGEKTIQLEGPSPLVDPALCAVDDLVTGRFGMQYVGFHDLVDEFVTKGLVELGAVQSRRIGNTHPRMAGVHGPIPELVAMRTMQLNIWVTRMAP